MSNSLAIGAVTATLRNLLDNGIAAEGGGLHTTTLPPEKAQTFGQADGAGRVNLFLYQTHINAAWRNMDMPSQIKPNETGQPPLALDLFYLLTAYERDDGDSSVIAHRLLGRAMRVLHDHPLLGADEIRTALPNNDLADQIERDSHHAATDVSRRILETLDDIPGWLPHLRRVSSLRRAD